jgi:hypothetical protein
MLSQHQQEIHFVLLVVISPAFSRGSILVSLVLESLSIDAESLFILPAWTGVGCSSPSLAVLGALTGSSAEAPFRVGKILT